MMCPEESFLGYVNLAVFIVNMFLLGMIFCYAYDSTKEDLHRKKRKKK